MQCVYNVYHLSTVSSSTFVHIYIYCTHTKHAHNGYVCITDQIWYWFMAFALHCFRRRRSSLLWCPRQLAWPEPRRKQPARPCDMVPWDHLLFLSTSWGGSPCWKFRSNLKESSNSSAGESVIFEFLGVGGSKYKVPVSSPWRSWRVLLWPAPDTFFARAFQKERCPSKRSQYTQ